jgi:hypothetical protein
VLDVALEETLGRDALGRDDLEPEGALKTGLTANAVAVQGTSLGSWPPCRSRVRRIPEVLTSDRAAPGRLTQLPPVDGAQHERIQDDGVVPAPTELGRRDRGHVESG